MNQAIDNENIRTKTYIATKINSIIDVFKDIYYIIPTVMKETQLKIRYVHYIRHVHVYIILHLLTLRCTHYIQTYQLANVSESFVA